MGEARHSSESRIVVHRVAFSTLLTLFLGIFVVGYSLLKSDQRNQIELYEQQVYDRIYFEGGNSKSPEPGSLRTTVYKKPRIREMSLRDYESRKSFDESAAPAETKSDENP